MKKFLLSLAVILSLAVVFVGCGNQPQTHTHESGSTTSSQQSVPSESNTDSVANGDVSDNNISTQSSTSSEQSTTSKPDRNAKISRDKAKEIALKDAGLKESDIFDYEIEYDNDGIRKYEIEFKSGKREYSYDINAKTGIIIKKEIDND